MPRRPSMLRVAGVTHSGRRATNQDCFRVGAVPGSGGRVAFVALADGVGGQPEGAKAAEAAVWAFQRGLATVDPDNEASFTPALAGGVAQAYRDVVSLAGRHAGGRHPSTTFVGAILSGRRAVAASIGDSRLYVLTGRGIRQVSRDHTVLNSALRNGIPRERLLDRRDALNRYLGKTPEVKPDLFDMSLPGSAILFLCTDGLSGSLSRTILGEEEIRRELLGRPTLEGALQNLVRLAHERGSPDNITVAAAELGRLPRVLLEVPMLPPLPGETVVSAGSTPSTA